MSEWECVCLSSWLANWLTDSEAYATCVRELVCAFQCLVLAKPCSRAVHIGMDCCRHMCYNFVWIKLKERNALQWVNEYFLSSVIVLSLKLEIDTDLSRLYTINSMWFNCVWYHRFWIISLKISQSIRTVFIDEKWICSFIFAVNLIFFAVTQIFAQAGKCVSECVCPHNFYFCVEWSNSITSAIFEFECKWTVLTTWKC